MEYEMGAHGKQRRWSEKETEHTKRRTKSRNVFYILFVGAHRVVEINKPNENETEQKTEEAATEAAATVAKKNSLTQIRISICS